VKIDVRGLLGSPGEQRAHRASVAVRILRPASSELAVDPAEVDLTLTATPQGVLVQGTINAVAHLTCGRCLIAYTESVEAEFAHLYVIRSGPDPAGQQVREFGAGVLDAESGEEVHLPLSSDEDLDTSPLVDGCVDLGPVLAEVLDLALPMKPLCREDCPGLCPTCGRSLDSGGCDCKTEDIDPRLAALARLLPEDSCKGPDGDPDAEDERKE